MNMTFKINRKTVNVALISNGIHLNTKLFQKIVWKITNGGEKNFLGRCSEV